MLIGIDLGGTKTEGILLNESNVEIKRIRQKTPQKQGYNAVLQTIVSVINELEKECSSKCSVGVASPGSVDQFGNLKNSNTLCLNGMSIRKDLEDLLYREIKIENDANCFTLAEAKFGAGQDSPSVFGVILGTGVGGGFILDNQLISGAQGIAGEWGHNSINSDGPLCYCGNRGCVETYLSGPGLMNNYQQKGGAIATSPEEVVKLSDKGDPLACEVMQNYFNNFGIALSMVINILDPHVVVIGGGLSHIDKLYSYGITQVSKNIFNNQLNTVIKKNARGDSAGVIGAANLWTL